MDRILRFINSGLLLLGIAAVVMAAVAGYQWWQQTKINDFVSNKIEETSLSHPHIRFHQAIQAAAAEDRQRARDIYTELGTGKGRGLRASAYYNRGNVNLNYALLLPEANPKRLPLIELAKQDYRIALGMSPSAHDIQYNLALALRQIPEGPLALPDGPKISPVLEEREIETLDFTSELP